MIAALRLAALLQIAASGAAPPDTVPRIGLADALARAARLDPAYVAALGAVDNAEWARRSASFAMVLPSVSTGVDASRYSSPSFNLGTGALSDVAVTARLNASYDLFLGGRKFAELSRSRAELARAQADELRARYDAGLRTEGDYSQELADEETSRAWRASG
ncbi:MAG: TolC family protein [Gemmatimonadaceae bacterium]